MNQNMRLVSKAMQGLFLLTLLTLSNPFLVEAETALGGALDQDTFFDYQHSEPGIQGMKKKKKKPAAIADGGELLGTIQNSTIVSRLAITRVKPKANKGFEVTCSAGDSIAFAVVINPTSKKKASVQYGNGNTFQGKRTRAGLVVKPKADSGALVGSNFPIKEKATIKLKADGTASVTLVGKQKLGRAGTCTYTAKGTIARTEL